MDHREGHRRPVYRIRLKGVLDGEWSDWFEGMKVQSQPGDETVLAGPLADQAALHGLLHKIRDMGLPLLSVEEVSMEDQSEPRLGGE
jgi:hypothetical protein